MKLPNSGSAIVEIEKLRGYCLNPHPPRGRHKDRVFAAVGFQEKDAAELRAALLAAARTTDVQLGETSPYGTRYILDFDLMRLGRIVRIRNLWIVESGNGLPRLTTCYVP